LCKILGDSTYILKDLEEAQDIGRFVADIERPLRDTRKSGGYTGRSWRGTGNSK
jgi:hypothetical protein